MTLETIYFASSIAAALGVIASLVFVGWQIRQNTLATRAVCHHSITDAMNQANLAMAQNPQLAQIWATGIQDRRGLNDQERWQLDTILLSYFHVFDTMHYQARIGAGDEGLLRAEEQGIASLMALPGVRDWWRDNPFGYSEEFRSFIDDLATAGGSQPT